MNGRYLTLAGRIRQEIQELARVVERTLAIWRQASRSTDDYYVDATALNLHGYYSGMEHILDMIADVVDQSKPTGANWHQELLRQMTAEVPGVRPAVLASETRDQLDRFRGFRHVVRNVYTYHLDPIQVRQLIALLPAAHQAAADELLRFAQFLEDSAGEQ